ncbi:MAG: hypothetical protein R3C56_21350 [Pirellulaceae bacterium]
MLSPTARLLDYETTPTHSVTVRVSDGSASYDEAVAISLRGVTNRADSGVPGVQTVAETSALTFSTGIGNAISVTDQNAGTNSLMQVSLSVTNGTFTLSQTTGLTIVAGANGSSSWCINGFWKVRSTRLSKGSVYDPATNYSGSANLQISASLNANLEGLL